MQEGVMNLETKQDTLKRRNVLAVVGLFSYWAEPTQPNYTILTSLLHSVPHKVLECWKMDRPPKE